MVWRSGAGPRKSKARKPACIKYKKTAKVSSHFDVSKSSPVFTQPQKHVGISQFQNIVTAFYFQIYPVLLPLCQYAAGSHRQHTDPDKLPVAPLQNTTLLSQKRFLSKIACTNAPSASLATQKKRPQSNINVILIFSAYCLTSRLFLVEWTPHPIRTYCTITQTNLTSLLPSCCWSRNGKDLCAVLSPPLKIRTDISSPKVW